MKTPASRARRVLHLIEKKDLSLSHACRLAGTSPTAAHLLLGNTLRLALLKRNMRLRLPDKALRAQAMQALRAAGWTYEEIGAAFGVTRQSVHKTCQNASA